MSVEYIIKTGPEELRKSDYCFDCEQIMVSGEKIYIIGFGSLPGKWGKVHEKCAENSQHWELWEIEKLDKLIKEANNKIYVKKSSNRYTIVVLSRGEYTNNQKYSLRDSTTGNELYRTSREERARGVEEFLNDFSQSLKIK
jgi:uncharacterized protein (UPF0248 family)